MEIILCLAYSITLLLNVHNKSWISITAHFIIHINKLLWFWFKKVQKKAASFETAFNMKGNMLTFYSRKLLNRQALLRYEEVGCI